MYKLYGLSVCIWQAPLDFNNLDIQGDRLSFLGSLIVAGFVRYFTTLFCCLCSDGFKWRRLCVILRPWCFVRFPDQMLHCLMHTTPKYDLASSPSHPMDSTIHGVWQDYVCPTSKLTLDTRSIMDPGTHCVLASLTCLMTLFYVNLSISTKLCLFWQHNKTCNMGRIQQEYMPHIVVIVLDIYIYISVSFNYEYLCICMDICACT